MTDVCNGTDNTREIKPSYVFIVDDEPKNYRMIREGILEDFTTNTQEELNHLLSQADIIKNDPEKAQELFDTLFHEKKLEAVIIDYDLGVG